MKANIIMPALAGLMLLAGSALHAQDLLYAENFATTNDWGRDQALGTPQTHWFGVKDGYNINNWAIETNNYVAGSGWIAGPAVNNSPAFPVDQHVGAMAFTQNTVYSVMLFTVEYTGILAENIGAISWDLICPSGFGGDYNLGLKVGGDWYTPSTGFSYAAGSDWNHYLVDLSTVTWVRLDGMDVEDNSAGDLAYIPRRSVGTTPVSLPTGTVQAFGVFFDNMLTNTAAIDNYRIWSTTAAAPAAPVAVIALSGANDLAVSFDSASDLTYLLQYSDDGMATWKPTGVSAVGDGAAMTLTDTGARPAAGQQIFHRVVVLK